MKKSRSAFAKLLGTSPIPLKNWLNNASDDIELVFDPAEKLESLHNCWVVPYVQCATFPVANVKSNIPSAPLYEVVNQKQLISHVIEYLLKNETNPKNVLTRGFRLV